MAAPDGPPPRLCPSAPATPGARLLGRVGADGRVHNLQTPLVVDDAFIAKLRARGSPEAQMRFAHDCVEGRCAQWTGHSCGVAEMVLTHMAERGIGQEGPLPPCTIRAECRWHAQSGAAACRACSFVVTDAGALPAAK